MVQCYSVGTEDGIDAETYLDDPRTRLSAYYRQTARLVGYCHKAGLRESVECVHDPEEV